MSTDPSFEQILERLPERDAAALTSQHGVKNIENLLSIQSQLQLQQVKDVSPAVQMALHVACEYLETLDSASSFTWEGFENFCDFNDNSGADVIGVEEETKRVVSTEESDPDGYNLTAEERRQLEQNVENDPLTMMIRGFSARSLQFEFDEQNNKKAAEDASEKTAVAFNGKVFYVGKCYYFHQPDGGKVIVGIRKFTRVS